MPLTGRRPWAEFLCARGCGHIEILWAISPATPQSPPSSPPARTPNYAKRTQLIAILHRPPHNRYTLPTTSLLSPSPGKNNPPPTIPPTQRELKSFPIPNSSFSHPGRFVVNPLTPNSPSRIARSASSTVQTYSFCPAALAASTSSLLTPP